MHERCQDFADSARQHPASSGVAPVSTVGRIGRAGLFNGISQYLDAGTVNLGDAFTLSAWVKIQSGATDIQTIWANQQGGYGSPGFALFVNTYLTSDQKVDFGSGNGTSGYEATTPGGAVSFGQWHLLTASVNRTNGSVESTFGSSLELGIRTRSHLSSQPMMTSGDFAPHQYSRWPTRVESIS
jgi:hypothetical protein